MKLEWEDATSYARGEHGKCEPRVWALRFSGGNLLVHRKIHQDGWFYTLRNLWIEDEPLDNVDIESAKKEAVERCFVAANDLVADLRRLL